jgi:hypothetical protein
MVFPKIAIENEVNSNAEKDSDIFLKEKMDSIEGSLKFDLPIVFNANDYPTNNDLNNAENQTQKPDEHVILSWENVNVYKKNEFKIMNLFKRKTRDASYLLQKDEMPHLNQTSSIKTISFTKNSIENESLESLASSTTSSNKQYTNNQILFNGITFFKLKNNQKVI